MIKSLLIMNGEHTMMIGIDIWTYNCYSQVLLSGPSTHESKKMKGVMNEILDEFMVFWYFNGYDYIRYLLW